MSWSKFKYNQSKKKKESKGKSVEQKEMWFKVNIEKGDLDHKIKRVIEFLTKKHSVKITIKVKGRVQQESIINLMKEVLENLKEHTQQDGAPKFEGKNYTTILRPAK